MLWNEPNNLSHWDRSLDPEWALFAEMIRLAGERLAQVRPGLRHAGKARQLAEREIHLARGTAKLVAPDRADEIFRQMLFPHQAEEGAARIGAGHDHRCAQLVAVFEHHSRSAAA